MTGEPREPIEIVLDGGTIQTEAQFHSAMGVSTGVDWYGGNLDALFDLLVGASPGPMTIRWHAADRSRAGIGDRFDRLVTVILDAVAYRADGSLRFLLEAGGEAAAPE